MRDDTKHERDEGEQTGRFRQRRRTRAQIVAATMALLKTNPAPTINDIAAAADVSRRTIYMHFPTLEQLLLDAKLGLLSQRAVDDAIEAADKGDNVEARVTAMVSAIASLSQETLPLGRSLIRLTVESAEKPKAGQPRRGYRRVAWIERAIAPLRETLTKREFERLVSVLAMVVGWESLIVLEDVRGLTREEQKKTTLWVVRALIHAALADASARRK